MYRRVKHVGGLFLALVIAGTTVAAWQNLLSWRERGIVTVEADIQRVEASSEEGFAYEYEAATFDVFMGEEAEQPKIKVTQGARKLDITVITVPVPATSPTPTPVIVISPSPEEPQETEAEAIPETEATHPSPGLPAGQAGATADAAPSPTAPAPASTLEPSPEPTVLPEPTVSPEVTLTPTPTPEVTSSPISLWKRIFSREVLAQEEIVVVNPDTAPAVVYQDKQFKLTPNLDKVTLDFEIGSVDSLPTLQIRTDQLTAFGGGDEIIFQTRTNRKAFKLVDAVIVDADGNEQEVALTVEGKLETDLKRVRDRRYEVGFKLSGGESAVIVQPAQLRLELISLFHDRMLPVQPAKRDFKAAEKLVFNITVADIADEGMNDALADDTFPEVRFGLIDAAGQTRELSAEIQQREGGNLQVALAPTTGAAEPGLFDLLIQRGGGEAYIAEDDFSWGVLAINPDMAIYLPEATARLDMGVLDKNGQQLCDANLLLTVENPTGNISQYATADGSITVSDTCHDAITEKPDYTAAYQVGSEGEYKLTLTSVTADGTFVIEDNFRVNAASPFYIRRTSHTRIFPLADYDMDIEITSAQDTGTLTVKEKVPANFKIGGMTGKNTTLESGNVITWQDSFKADEPKIFSYKYDAPDESPALYLLGPIKIFRQTDEIFNEGRQWQLAIDADSTVILDANGDGDCGPGCWTVPNNWSDVNTIYAIGGGGAGDNLSTGGGGGGGGAFAMITNLDLTADDQITFGIGAAGTDAVNGGPSWFNAASAAACTDSAACVKGAGGTTATDATGASGGSISGTDSVGTTRSAGGPGGTGDATGDDSAGGGGGAGSPDGTGGTGGAGDSNAGGDEAQGGGGGSGCDSAGTSNDGIAGGAQGGNGGASCFASGGSSNNAADGSPGTDGSGAAGGDTGQSGGQGGAGSSDPALAGGGGGGGDDDSPGVGGAGGNYGGGGGGGSTVGNGAGGVVIIIYTQVVAGPTTDQVMRHGNWFDSGVEQGFYWAD